MEGKAAVFVVNETVQMPKVVVDGFGEILEIESVGFKLAAVAAVASAIAAVVSGFALRPC
ncbi:MAG: hypothetical protein L3K02_06780 [Thermoplasmata archaeon]|nr:hypothetical protein [Thermoplasmata archaeon]